MDDGSNPYAEIIERHRDWIARHGDGSFDAWGFECGPGWAGLLGKLFDDIAAVVRAPGARLNVRQVKEKFGTLRFYYDLVGDLPPEAVERIRDAVERAEFRSGATCEACGARGMLRGEGYLHVACDDHARPDSRVLGDGSVDFAWRDGEGVIRRVRYDPDADEVTRGVLTEAEYEDFRTRSKS
jgi:hypothetical protein